MGNRDRGMDGQGEGNTSDVHEKGFNGGNLPSPIVAPLDNATHPLGVCPIGTQKQMDVWWPILH